MMREGKGNDNHRLSIPLYSLRIRTKGGKKGGASPRLRGKWDAMMGGPRNATVLIPLVRFSEVRKGDKGASECSEAKRKLGKLMGILAWGLPCRTQDCEDCERPRQVYRQVESRMRRRK